MFYHKLLVGGWGLELSGPQWDPDRRSWGLPRQGNWEMDRPEEGPPWAVSGVPLARQLPSQWWTHLLSSVLFLLPLLLASSSALTHFRPCLPPPYVTIPCPRGSYVTKSPRAPIPTSQLPPRPRLSGTILHSWLDQALKRNVERGSGWEGERGHSSPQQGLDEAPWEAGALQGKPWPMACCQETQAGFLCLNSHLCKMRTVMWLMILLKE